MLNLRTATIVPNSLICMRKYKATDFPWGFLVIFYKLEALMKIIYVKPTNGKVGVNDLLLYGANPFWCERSVYSHMDSESDRTVLLAHKNKL